MRNKLNAIARTDVKSKVREEAVKSLASFSHDDTRATLWHLVENDPSYAVGSQALRTLVKVDRKNCKPDLLAALEHAYRVEPGSHSGDARQVVHEAGTTTLSGVEQLSAIAGEDYKPVAEYPQTELARRLLQVARLIKADVGLAGWAPCAGPPLFRLLA